MIFLGATVKLNHLESKSLDMRQTRILLAGKEDERSGGVSCFPRFSIEMNRTKVLYQRDVIQLREWAF